MFHSAGQQEVAFVGLDCPRCVNNRRESARAKTVYGFSRNARRKPREQGGHARHVSVVFARLIRAAHKGIIKCGPVQPRMALDQFANGMGRQIVGADRAKAASKAANGSSYAVY